MSIGMMDIISALHLFRLPGQPVRDEQRGERLGPSPQDAPGGTAAPDVPAEEEGEEDGR